jgi:hypothetical protein
MIVISAVNLAEFRGVGTAVSLGSIDASSSGLWDESFAADVRNHY